MAFLFRLEMEDGSPADPPTLSVAVPNMRVGDVIPLGSRSLLVVDKRDDGTRRPSWSWRKVTRSRRAHSEISRTAPAEQRGPAIAWLDAN
jgi:NMD protein affecting ribosome stability and mRNA decay